MRLIRGGGSSSGGLYPHLIISSDTGSTVTATKGTTSIRATETSTGVFECDVDSFGTWTITSVLGQDEAVSMLFVDTCKLYNVNNHLFEYTEWLELGGVTGTYSSLDDVFADEAAVRRLMTVHASADYLIHAQEINSDTIDLFTVNDTAMKWIGLRDYVCDGLTALEGVEAKFLASEYWERYLKDHVPVMTSNTAPYGSCISNAATISNHYAYTAFDNNDSTNWACSGSSGVANSYIGYYFTNPICVNKVFVKVLTSAQAYSFKVQHSDDNSTWIDTDGLTHQSSANGDYFDVENSSYHLYWRIIIPTAKDTDNTITLQFYGRSLNVSVPVMTSNTAPYGEASGGDLGAGSAYYYAFDDNDTTHADVGENIIYKFTTPMVIKKFSLITRTDYQKGGGTYIWSIRGSNDGSNWDDLITGLTYTTANHYDSRDIDNNTPYLYYEIFATQQATWGGFNAVQFYGVDYSEKEFETGTTRKWLYDHGLLFETLIPPTGSYISGGSIANIDECLKIIPSTVNYGGYEGIVYLDASPYSVMRTTIRNLVSSATVGVAGLKVQPTTSADGQGDAVLLYPSGSSSLPNTIGLDISSFNTQKYLCVLIGNNQNNTSYGEFSEWWLE